MSDQASEGVRLAPGDRGEAVRDLQRRLSAAGFDQPATDGACYGACTESAVRQFQATRRLPVTGVCDPHTWMAVVEAGHRLGDRLLYLRSPMVRGEDVSDLQLRLGSLGFDTGWVDGIFGPATEAALKDFQRNCGLTVDGVAGRDVVGALHRMGPRVAEPTSVAGVRERERLRRAPRALHDHRLAVGEGPGSSVVAAALGRALQERGATVAVFQHPELSVQASEANAFTADAYLGVEIDEDGPCRAAYYATDGFESTGGRRLAELLTEALDHEHDLPTTPAQGLRLPVLRETRMAAVWCVLGPASAVVARGSALAELLAAVVGRWAATPVET